jgi:hypothetical protein
MHARIVRPEFRSQWQLISNYIRESGHKFYGFGRIFPAVRRRGKGIESSHHRAENPAQKAGGHDPPWRGGTVGVPIRPMLARSQKEGNECHESD